MKVKIVDSMFGHVNSIGSIKLDLPQDIEWDRNVSVDDDIVFYTKDFNNPQFGKKKIALLIESPLVTTQLYESIKENYTKFDYVFTFDKELLTLDKRFVFYELGGCWVDFINEHTKTKNVSLIASYKNELPGHRIRHQIVNRYKPKIDLICGRGYSPIKNKSEALNNFRFSIVAENCKQDYYFTEKLIDCFATKTIPIYWGCDVSKFFFRGGMLEFNDISQLDQILSAANADLYNNMKSFVDKNYEQAKKYYITENNISRVLNGLICSK